MKSPQATPATPGFGGIDGLSAPGCLVVVVLLLLFLPKPELLTKTSCREH